MSDKYYTRHGRPMKEETFSGGKVNPFNVLTDTEIDQATYDTMVADAAAQFAADVAAGQAAREAVIAAKAADAADAKTKLMGLGLTSDECDALIGV